jgi:hypothetical protein
MGETGVRGIIGRIYFSQTAWFSTECSRCNFLTSCLGFDLRLSLVLRPISALFSIHSSWLLLFLLLCVYEVETLEYSDALSPGCAPSHDSIGTSVNIMETREVIDRSHARSGVMYGTQTSDILAVEQHLPKHVPFMIRLSLIQTTSFVHPRGHMYDVASTLRPNSDKALHQTTRLCFMLLGGSAPTEVQRLGRRISVVSCTSLRDQSVTFPNFLDRCERWLPSFIHSVWPLPSAFVFRLGKARQDRGGV